MIEEHIKIHDKFSAEIKTGFVARKKQQKNNFAMHIWMFIPNSLDINRFTYSKAEFYRDLKTNIRLITPVYILRDIAEGEHSAFRFLYTAFCKLASEPTRTHKQDYEYQIKMFLSILKSSLREEVEHIVNSSPADLDYLITNYREITRMITEKYRDLYRIINVPTVTGEMMEYYRFGDEFMSNLIELQTFRLIEGLKTKQPNLLEQYKRSLLAVVNKEYLYKKDKGLLVVEKENKTRNNEVVHRFGMLKKYAESHLFLQIYKRRDGVLAEQLLFSLAAGVSMIFATVIAFSVQQKYGNFTMPLFVALVVSYMLKDRLKDFTRHYFAHKMGHRYFDNKIDMSINHVDIGWSKESIDFIAEKNVPADVLKARDRSSIIEANNRAGGEQVILYRTHMFIDRVKLDATSPYSIAGVNSIIRFNISNFIRNMDNADFPLFYPDEKEGFLLVKGEKLYYLNLVIHKQNDEQKNFQRYRIALNRKGIHAIEKL